MLKAMSLHTRRRATLAAIALAAGILAAGGVHAAPCAGFDDVDTSATYCTAVQWIKSRGVTLGCTATSYCPDAAVNRAQMALFMSRLSTALLPQFYSQSAHMTSQHVAALFFKEMACKVTVPAAAFTRTARVSGSFYGSASGGEVQMWLAYKKDGSLPQLIGTDSLLVPTSESMNVAYTAAPSLTLDAGGVYQLLVALNNNAAFDSLVSASTCFIDAVVITAAP